MKLWHHWLVAPPTPQRTASQRAFASPRRGAAHGTSQQHGIVTCQLVHIFGDGGNAAHAPSVMVARRSALAGRISLIISCCQVPNSHYMRSAVLHRAEIHSGRYRPRWAEVRKNTSQPADRAVVPLHGSAARCPCLQFFSITALVDFVMFIISLLGAQNAVIAYFHRYTIYKALSFSLEFHLNRFEFLCRPTPASSKKHSRSIWGQASFSSSCHGDPNHFAHGRLCSPAGVAGNRFLPCTVAERFAGGAEINA